MVMMRCGGKGLVCHLVSAGILYQPLGELSLFRNEVQVRTVMYSVHLIGDSLLQRRMSVAQTTGSNASSEIQIFLALGVVQLAPFSVGYGHWVPSVGGHHIVRIIRGSGTRRDCFRRTTTKEIKQSHRELGEDTASSCC